MLNTLLGKQRGLGIRLKWASRILAGLVRVITNLPFSYLWVATSSDSDNFFRDFISQIQQYILYFSVRDVTPDVSFFLYQFKRKREIENNLNISPASVSDEKSIAFLSLQNELWYACWFCTL